MAWRVEVYERARDVRDESWIRKRKVRGKKEGGRRRKDTYDCESYYGASHTRIGDWRSVS